MEQNEKIKQLDDKLQKINEKTLQAKERLAVLQGEKQKIEYERMQCVIGAYLPIIEEIGLSPEELKEFITGSTPTEETSTTYSNAYASSYENEGVDDED